MQSIDPGKSSAPQRCPCGDAPGIRAVTDERGIAEVRVANGANKLFVSQSRYLTFGLAVEVDADMTTRAVAFRGRLYIERN